MSLADLADDLIARIATRRAVLGFIGLGYAGLPLALAFANEGHPVRAFDRDPDRAGLLARGQLPFARDEPSLDELLAAAQGRDFRVGVDAEVLTGADVVFIAVDTPIGADHAPDIENLLSAARTASRQVRRGAAVVIESTVGPGTVLGPVRTAIEHESALRVGIDLFLLHCPERVRPGRMLANLRRTRRVLGAEDPDTARVGAALYSEIVKSPIDVVDVRTAEVVKTAENAARDVQIALANQLAVVCDAHGVDVERAASLINALWSGEPLVLRSGPGVGGHCLPKDPWLLVAGLAADDTPLVRGARAMNGRMPHHVVELARRLLHPDLALEDATVAVLGTAYKADADDERNSPGLAIARELERVGASVRVHDPVVPARRGDLNALVGSTDLLVFAVRHTAYTALEPVALCAPMRGRRVLDAAKAWDRDRVAGAGIAYAALGHGDLRER